MIVVGRLGLAYLFFSQLFWKLPPSFGCRNDNAFPQPAVENFWTSNGSAGLCFWLGMQSIYAPEPRQVLVADMTPAGLPKIGIPITPLAQVNGLLVDNVIRPGLPLFGWLIWLAELWIVISMALGFLARLGALTAVGVSAQLWVGLANIPRPYEWEWSYGSMLLLSLVLFGVAAGRVFGVDEVLRRRYGSQGNWIGRAVRWLT
jgi:hypothetical protein